MSHLGGYITGLPEVVGTLIWCDGVECGCQGVVDVFDGTAHGLAHGMLDFGKGFLDRVKVGTVGRQEEQLCTCGADRGPDGLALVAAEVIDHDNVARMQCLDQLGLDVGVESLGIDRPVDDPRCFDVVMA